MGWFALFFLLTIADPVKMPSRRVNATGEIQCCNNYWHQCDTNQSINQYCKVHYFSFLSMAPWSRRVYAVCCQAVGWPWSRGIGGCTRLSHQRLSNRDRDTEEPGASRYTAIAALSCDAAAGSGESDSDLIWSISLSGIGAFTIVDGHTVTGEDVGNK